MGTVMFYHKPMESHLFRFLAQPFAVAGFLWRWTYEWFGHVVCYLGRLILWHSRHLRDIRGCCGFFRTPPFACSVRCILNRRRQSRAVFFLEVVVKSLPQKIRTTLPSACPVDLSRENIVHVAAHEGFSGGSLVRHRKGFNTFLNSCKIISCKLA